ncbi:hypothetical protein [Streptomyces sp. TP-A0874]|uniref:hypothetical protein n=1 Tax=Streptomyces sp. TP-A0874 TaxID=549819 RepID=UPI001112FB3C|nr:hypothetical protein [Streptomyces sp. TP-A0874]
MNGTSRPESERSELPGPQPEPAFPAMPPRPSHNPPSCPPPQTPAVFRHVPQPPSPNASPHMPQPVRTARILLYLLSGLLIVLGLAALVQAEATLRAFDAYGESSARWLTPAGHEAARKAAAQAALAQAGMVWNVVYAVLALVLAARFGNGGNALRVGTVVYGAWLAVVGTFTLGLTASFAGATTTMASVVQLAAGVLLIILLLQEGGVAWFRRPRP